MLIFLSSAERRQYNLRQMWRQRILHIMEVRKGTCTRTAPHPTTGEDTEFARVPRHPDFWVSRVGDIVSFKKMGRYGGELEIPRLKRQRVNNLGYPVVATEHGKIIVHRAVLSAFVGDCPGAHACHNDGDPRNCSLENLRWDTAKGNHADRWEHGTMHHTIPREERKSIYARYQAGEAQKVLAEEYGVDPSTIGFNIRRYCEDHGLTRRDPRAKRIPDGDVAQVYRRYESGETLASIGDSYDGLSQTQVLRRIQKWHMAEFGKPLPPRTKRVTKRVQIDEIEVLRRIRMGESQRSIAADLGVSTGPIRRILEDSGTCSSI